MTVKESLKYLKDFIDNDPQIGYYNTTVLKEAIDALEKRVPKKPLPASDIDEEYLLGNEAVCPNCRHMVAPYNGYYCPRCGQLIDWEDEE